RTDRGASTARARRTARTSSGGVPARTGGAPAQPAAPRLRTRRAPFPREQKPRRPSRDRGRSPPALAPGAGRAKSSPAERRRGVGLAVSTSLLWPADVHAGTIIRERPARG